MNYEPDDTTDTTETHMGFFRIDLDSWARLQDLATKDDRPVSHLARKAVEQYLARRAS